MKNGDGLVSEAIDRAFCKEMIGCFCVHFAETTQDFVGAGVVVDFPSDERFVPCCS